MKVTSFLQLDTQFKDGMLRASVLLYWYTTYHSNPELPFSIPIPILGISGILNIVALHVLLPYPAHLEYYYSILRVVFHCFLSEA